VNKTYLESIIDPCHVFLLLCPTWIPMVAIIPCLLNINPICHSYREADASVDALENMCCDFIDGLTVYESCSTHLNQLLFFLLMETLLLV